PSVWNNRRCAATKMGEADTSVAETAKTIGLRDWAARLVGAAAKIRERRARTSAILAQTLAKAIFRNCMFHLLQFSSKMISPVNSTAAGCSQASADNWACLIAGAISPILATTV